MKTIPAQAVLRFIARMEREDVCLHGFELRHDGMIRAEGYYAPFVKGAPHRMYSVSKSMVSLAVGLLAEEGAICLDEPVANYFTDRLPPRPDGRLMRTTVRHLLRMTTCHARTAYAEGVDTDWASAFFAKPATHEPGTVFAYDTSATQVLGVLCERASGMPLLAYLQQHVFDVIGAKDPKRWLTDPAGNPQGGTGLLMSLRDLGKVAQVVLDGGGDILPGAYLAEATRKQTETLFSTTPEERHGYGYQFWRTRAGYAMYGMGGMLAIGCPQKRMLLCTVGNTRLDAYGVQRIYDAFFEEIYPAKSVQHDAEAERALARKLASLRVGALLHNPACAGMFHASYRMEDNPMGLRAVRFGRQSVTLVRADSKHIFVYDVGDVREGTFQGVPCLTSGGWVAPGVLRVRRHCIGDAPCGMELLFAARENRLTVQARRSADPLTVGYEGFAGGTAVP